MKIKEVIAIEEVKCDLDDGENFYERQESGLGAYFRDCIITDMESLKLYAGTHSKKFGFFRMFSMRFPYAVYYEIKGDTAIIVAVLDMRRDPTIIREKLSWRKE